MTAVIGILNKRAVAIAADSAVTITDGQSTKILNQANKVFTLSKCHPVGVMIYNSASLMATPWEVIIKIYRKQLKDRFFDNLDGYQKDFFEFLKAKKYYSDNTINDDYLDAFIASIIDDTTKEIANETEHDDPDPLKDFELFKPLFERKLQGLYDVLAKRSEFCPDFEEYSFEEYLDETELIRKRAYTNYFADLVPPPELVDLLDKVSFVALRSREDVTRYTGLVFVGYGEEDIYPSLIPVNISFAVGNRLRYYIDENNVAIISNSNSASVCPFAQTDVIDTILRGVAPDLESLYIRSFIDSFRAFQNVVLDSIGDSNPLLTEQIKSIPLNHLPDKVVQIVEDYKLEKFLHPLIEAVESLSKEDLSEMAESLIYLTYLKRRMTNAEESVGGPVDVAIISKGDGFVWIKRKHYFRPELNTNFFNNYLKI